MELSYSLDPKRKNSFVSKDSGGQNENSTVNNSLLRSENHVFIKDNGTVPLRDALHKSSTLN